jgi:hypothetical protein
MLSSKEGSREGVWEPGIKVAAGIELMKVGKMTEGD